MPQMYNFDFKGSLKCTSKWYHDLWIAASISNIDTIIQCWYSTVFILSCLLLCVLVLTTTMQATLNQWLCPFILTDSLCSLLWNLYKYYTQFSESIQTKITQLRTPIEKELKVGETKAGKTDVWCWIYFGYFLNVSYWFGVIFILIHIGLCQNLQVEWCQFLVHQAVSGKDTQVRVKFFFFFF